MPRPRDENSGCNHPSMRGGRQPFFSPVSNPVMSWRWKRRTMKAVGKGLAGWLLPRTNLHIPQTGRPVCFEGLHVSRVNLVSHVQWRLWRQGRGNQTPSRALRCCSCQYFNELCYSILVWRHHRIRVHLVCMCGFKLQEMNPIWR